MFNSLEIKTKGNNMKNLFFILLILGTSCLLSAIQNNYKDSDGIYHFKVLDIDGNEVKLSDYSGKVLLIVNVASRCGYTKQYEGLQKIYEKYNSEGFEILAFPCNDFKGQEPGTNEEIKEFCSANFGVTFPLFDKVQVIGDKKSPLYSMLINATEDSGDVKWNFEKFLISKEGKPVQRFRSKVTPESEEITSAIDTLLLK